jgi:hypothetical protein
MGVPTVAQMIAKVIELRDKVDAKTKAYKESIKDDEADIDLLESLLLAEINKLDGQSIRTANGTAIRVPFTSFRVVDRQVWFDWVFDAHQDQMLTAHVAKEAVKEHLDEFKKLPPGLDMTMIYRCNVRRPD